MDTTKKNIFIAGHYGFGNTGDEAILGAILAELRSQKLGLEIVVASSNPEVTASQHHVRSVHWKNIPSLMEAARQSDLIMIGGGGVFVDYWGVPADTQLTEDHWGIAYYNAIGLLAAMFNKPFMIHSVGVGPLLTEEGQRLTRLTFELADLATVRDIESKNLLKSIGIPAGRIRITPDPALCLPSNRDFVFELFRKAGIAYGEQPILGVCVRAWENAANGNKWQQETAEALDRFLESNDARVLFIPFQKEADPLEDDVAAAMGILRLMRRQDKASVLQEIYPPEIVKGLISSCQVVVGMRLHSLIFAAGASVPAMAISYDPKVANFMSSVGLTGNTLHLQQIKAEGLFQMLEQIWSEPERFRKILSKFSSKSNKEIAGNIQTALELMSGKPSRIAPETEAKLLREIAVRTTGLLAERERRLRSSWTQKVKGALNKSPWSLGQRFRKIRARLLTPGGGGEKILIKLPQRLGAFLKRTREAVKRHGLLQAIARAMAVFVEEFTRFSTKIIFRRTHLAMLDRLEKIIASHEGFIDVFPAPMGWSTKWFQRFQQFSLQAAKMDGLALYGGFPPLDRGLYIFKEVSKNLIVFDGMDRRVVRRVFEALQKTSQPRLLRIESVDLGTTLETINEAMQNGFKVVYEYIDEISPEIVGPVPDILRRRHEALLKNEEVFIIATSDQLYEKVRACRSRNFILSTNGVDVDHWRVNRGIPPSDLQPVLDGRQIVAYHGTLAKWVDYELLRMIADSGRYNLLLIGHEHDDSFAQSGLKQHSRVFFLGGKSYFELNQYAAFYDITILPFRKTYMTEAVSPVKIFEYMAARKPIVTTDLRECRKYKSCLVAKDNPDFMQKLLNAERSLLDTTYLKILDKEAEENSWMKKTREVLEMTGIEV